MHEILFDVSEFLAKPTHCCRHLKLSEIGFSCIFKNT